MKCPLTSRATYSMLRKVETLSADCLKGNCAWWDEDKNCCAVKEAGKSLGLILATMPKESAFRR